jgi:ABC-type bacteriocin/lantibiotic exporter with double-glycine peptidase domain
MLNQTFATLGPALLLLFGGYLVVTGQTTVGTVVGVVTILAAYGRVGRADLSQMSTVPTPT